jgi:hypothetical protein
VPSPPLNAPLCPVCGQPNACAVSATGTFEAECWCRSVTFSEDLLAQVPPNLKNMACICRSRAERSNEHHSGQGQTK